MMVLLDYFSGYHQIFEAIKKILKGEKKGMWAKTYQRQFGGTTRQSQGQLTEHHSVFCSEPKKYNRKRSSTKACG
jgi:hypothetical protein